MSWGLLQMKKNESESNLFFFSLSCIKTGIFLAPLCSLFYWRVPFLSWMAIIVLAGAGILLYFVPLRYVILVWGINKYTKRLRNPNFIDNNELLDFLSRSPTNRQFEQWRELSMVVHSKQALDKKSYKKQKSTIKKKTN